MSFHRLIPECKTYVVDGSDIVSLALGTAELEEIGGLEFRLWQVGVTNDCSSSWNRRRVPVR